MALASSLSRDRLIEFKPSPRVGMTPVIDPYAIAIARVESQVLTTPDHLPPDHSPRRSPSPQPPSDRKKPFHRGGPLWIHTESDETYRIWPQNCFNDKLPVLGDVTRLKASLMKIPQIASNKTIGFDHHHEIMNLLNTITMHTKNVHKFVNAHNTAVYKMKGYLLVAESQIADFKAREDRVGPGVPTYVAHGSLPWRSATDLAGYMQHQVNPSGAGASMSPPTKTPGGARDGESEEETDALIASLSDAVSAQEEEIRKLKEEKKMLQGELHESGLTPATTVLSSGSGCDLTAIVATLDVEPRRAATKVDRLLDLDPDEAEMLVGLDLTKDYNAERISSPFRKEDEGLSRSICPSRAEGSPFDVSFVTARKEPTNPGDCDGIATVQVIRAHNAIAKLHNSFTSTRESPLVALWDYNTSPPGPATDFPRTVQEAWELTEPECDRLARTLRMEGMDQADWHEMELEGKRSKLLGFCAVREKGVFELWGL